MPSCDLGLDHCAPHRRVGEPVSGDAEGDQPGVPRDEAVSVPVSQQPASLDAVMVQNRTHIKVQVPGEERQEGIRPANRAVDAGHRTSAEEFHDFLVIHVQGKVLQARSASVPFQDSDSRLFGRGCQINAQRLHVTER